MGFLDDLLRSAQFTAERVFAPQPQKKSAPAPARRPMPSLTSAQPLMIGRPGPAPSPVLQVRQAQAPSRLNMAPGSIAPRPAPPQLDIGSFLATLGSGFQQAGGNVADMALMGGGVLEQSAIDINPFIDEAQKQQRRQQALRNTEALRNKIKEAKTITGESLNRYEDYTPTGDFLRDAATVAGRSAMTGLDATMFVNPARAGLAGLSGKQALKQVAKTGAKEAALFGGGTGGATAAEVYGQTGDINKALQAGAQAAALAGGAQFGLNVGGYAAGKGIRAFGKPAVDAQRSSNRAVREGGFIAGPNARGFKDAQKNGLIFDGVDGKQRFEVSDQNMKIKNPNGKTLGEMIDHPELFDNYPDLKNLKVEKSDLMQGANASYIMSTDKIQIPSKGKVNLSDLLHETQHAVQKRENFGGGGDFGFARNALKEDLNPRLDKLERRRHSIFRKIDEIDVEERLKTGKSVTAQEKKLYDELQVLRRDINSLNDRLMNPNGFPAYQRLAGEAEARAVQARMNMPMSERYVKPDLNDFEKRYHQTSSKAAEAIKKEGFKLDNRTSGANDILPVGVNTKKTSKDLGLGDADNQLEVYFKKDANIKQFSSRDEAESFFMNHPDGGKFRDAVTKSKQLDQQFQARVDEVGKRLDDRYSEIWNKGIKTKDDPTYQKIRAEEEKLMDDWGKAVDEQSQIAQKESTRLAQKEGWDGMHMDADTGSFGRVTDNTIILDPSKVNTESRLPKRSTFYDSLDVPKDELIVRQGGGTAMSIDDAFIQEEAGSYRDFDDMVEQLSADIYANNRGGAGTVIGRTDDLGRGGQRISENPPFYQEFYKEFGKKPSKADVRQLVKDFLEGKNNAVRWELPDEVRDIATLVKQKAPEEGIKVGKTPFDDPTAIKPLIKQRQQNIAVRKMEREGDYVTSKNVNPNVKAAEKRYSVNDDGELIPDKKGATSLFTDKDGKVTGFRVGTEYFDAKALGDLSTVNGYGSTLSTMRRNVERAFDGPTGEKVNNFLVDHQQAQATKLIDRQLSLKQEMKKMTDDLGISFGVGRGKAKKVSAAIQDFGEGARSKADIIDEFGPEMAEKIVRADKWFRTQYDNLLKEMNTTLKAFGYDPVPKRKNYYTHFQDETLWRKFGLKMQEIRDLSSPTMQDANPQAGRGAISNKLAGMSEQTKPVKAFNRFALQRKGDTHTSDAFKAFELYLNPTLNNIYMTPSIARARVIARAVAQDADMAGKDANKTIIQLREWANSLAGKSNRIGDRFMADTMAGPHILKALSWAQRTTGQNSIVGNLSTAVMQPIVLAQTAGKFGYKNTATGLFQQATGAVSKAQAQSSFLRRRYSDVTPITASKLDRTRKVANIPLETVEETATRSTWNAAYNDAISRNLTGKKAIQYADVQTEKTVAGRSIGERPEAFRSKTLGLATMFQLEVNNFWQQTTKEMSKAEAAKVMVAMYGLNLLLQEITGRQVGFNPIDAAIDTYEEATKDRPTDEKATRIAQRWTGEFVDNAPFVGMALNTAFGEKKVKEFTGDSSNAGRFGVASPIRTLVDNPWMALSPVAGSQIKKTTEAVPVLWEGKLKDKEGETLVNVPQTPGNIARGLAFGKGAIPEVSQYYNNLGKKKIDQKLVQNQTISKAAGQSLDGLTKKQQELAMTTPDGNRANLISQYRKENLAKYKEDQAEKTAKSEGKATAPSTDKSVSAKKAAVTRQLNEINKDISGENRSTLEKYIKMDSDARTKWFNTENDAEYKYYKAKYENDKAEGKISKIQDVRRRKLLAKDEVGSKYSKEVRDLYQLGKADLYDYVTKAKNGEQLAKDLLAYDQALYAKGLTTYGSLKFKNGLAPATGGRRRGSGTRRAGSRKGRGGSKGGGKGTKEPNANSENISTTANVRNKVASAKVAKRTLNTSGGVRTPGIKAYKKPTKTNVPTRRA